jgi:hypothetical protein
MTAENAAKFKLPDKTRRTRTKPIRIEAPAKNLARLNSASATFSFQSKYPEAESTFKLIQKKSKQ